MTKSNMLKNIVVGVVLMPLFFSVSNAKELVGTYRGYELPSYTVLVKENQTEIRQYEPQLMSEVTVEGDRKKAVNTGFRILSSYIFGKNESATSVTMTTPVTQAKSNGAWVVRFGMPKDYTKETLPKTNDGRIRFVTSKTSKRAVIRFSGFARDKVIAKQTKLLEVFIAQQKCVVLGDPLIAYYDDPFTFPWNRRNEIMIEVK